MKMQRVIQGVGGMVGVVVWTGIIGTGLSVGVALGQTGTSNATAVVPAVEATGMVAADEVTINVDDGPIAQVLNAFSRQTGLSIVVGPEVTGKVTARLSNVKWRDALDAILKPYGYGYYLVGDTIIISAIEKIPKMPPGSQSGGAAAGVPPVPPPEPVLVKVFELKYLDAADVEEMVRSQLSPLGKVSRLIIRSQSWQGESGWGAAGGGGGGGAETVGRLKRTVEGVDLTKGKTLVVVDAKSAITRITEMLSQIDKMPTQVLIEAKFVEINAELLKDAGVEWGTGANGASTPGVQTVGTTANGKLYAVGGQQISGNAVPLAFSQNSPLSPVSPFNGGAAFAFQKLTDFQFQVLIHMLQEDESYKVLSSPRILAINNQDATIIVGQKFPIIQSSTTANGGGGATVSTSLQYYESIGIQLKVLPQVCDGGYINLIVHPSVRDIASLQSGKVSSGTGGANSDVSLTSYPVLDTREAETQVMVKSGQTIVIGGMLKDRKQTSQVKVPFLGSIPLLGVLFRRETTDTQKTELLVFLTATIHSPAEEQGVKAPSSASQAEMTPLTVGAAPKK